MVINYLEKIREKFQKESIELNQRLGKVESEYRENVEIIKLLEINDDPNFESFSPRPVNSFNKNKIIELKDEQKILQKEIDDLKIKIAKIEEEITEVTEVIKSAKECIF